MLNNLYIKNFALFKELSVDFEKGLNIISGETGAGKSILINAIGLLTGTRINKGFLGKFGDHTIVEASFTTNEKLKSFLLENDIEPEDNIIITRRFNENSSTIKLNNRPINLSLLSEMSQDLLDIHGQHSQLIVLNKSNYISIIDAFNKDTLIIKDSIKENIKSIKSLELELDNIDIDEDQVLRELDLLNFQIDEIESFDFENYDDEEFSEEHKRLSNQTEIIEGLQFINGVFNEGYQRKSLKDLANEIYAKLSDISEFDNNLKEYLIRFTDIRESINDISREIDVYSYTLDFDEQRLIDLENIFTNLQNLKRKYGKDIEDIKEFLNKSKSRVITLNNIEKIRVELHNRIAKLNRENHELAQKLTAIRKTIIKKLEKRIIDELLEMNMINLQFKIELTHIGTISDTGQDLIDFMISTNKGQELKSLNTVASGGEISRFMLALKAVLADYEQVQTIVFDEIDTGISGMTANVVGNKLAKISKKRQLIVITHLPQIASKADAHYLIDKQTTEANTISNVYKLDEQKKVMEVARLISGSNITQTSIKSASELIEQNSL